MVNLLVPNADAMRQQLEHLFGGDLDGHHNGLIELAWTDTFPGKDGKYKLSHALMFGTDQFEELIEEAVRRNSVAYCNVYIGAALRKPETPPFGRASDSDVLALTCAYADLDDEGAGSNMPLDCKPTMLVVTGLAPHARMQCWWRLIDPVTDPEELKDLIRGIAVTIGGDETVVNPSRVMRLAGSIAWAQKPGRQIELTSIMPLRDPSQAVYEVPELMRRFPVSQDSFPIIDHNPSITGYDQTAQITQIDPNGAIRGQTPLGLPGKVVDHRDVYLRDTVEAVMIQLIGESGRVPSPQELINAVWVQYSAQADLNKAGKGIEAVIEKCTYTLRRFARGRISGCRSMAQAQAIYAKKRSNGGYARAVVVPPQANGGFSEFDDGPVINPEPLILTSPQFVSRFIPPDYLIDGFIQKSLVYSLTGPTGHGKTPVSMLLGVKVALGQPYHDRPGIQGSVLFLAGENSNDIMARYISLSDQIPFDIDTIPFNFIDGVIDLEAELPRIRRDAALIPNLTLVIVDTDQAYFLGDEGNSNEQRKAFAKTLRKLLKLPGNPAVVVNCHPVKNAGRDGLVPIGGSSFLNEIDGNIMCWAEDRTTTIWPHTTKWRGVAFEPMAFELRTIFSEKLKDTKGRPLPSVMAVPVTEEGVQRRSAVAEEDDKSVLRMFYRDKQASFASIAKAVGWFLSDGQTPSKTKVSRVVERLKASKMVYAYHNGKYRITKKGAKFIGEKWKDDGADGE